MARTDITSAERRIFGVLTFVISFGPVVLLLTMLAFFLVDAHLPWGAPGGAFLAFIIMAGLNVPMMLILGGIADDSGEFKLVQWRRPFSLFELWWKHIR